jgi:hypothetical protein
VKAAKDEYEKQEVVNIWSDAGFHAFAQRTWMKIAPAKRGYTMGNMVENLGKAHAYDALYALLADTPRNMPNFAPKELTAALMASEGVLENSLAE